MPEHAEFSQRPRSLTGYCATGVPHDYPDNNGKTPVELTRNPNTAKLLEEWAAKTAKGDL